MTKEDKINVSHNVTVNSSKNLTTTGATKDFIVINGMLKPRKQISSSARASRASTGGNSHNSTSHDNHVGVTGSNVRKNSRD